MTTTASILVVADDEESCNFVAKILSARAWRTDTTWVGSAAVDLARKNNYDAVVFDYRNPGLDGADICRRVHEAQPRSRQIFLAGSPTIETVHLAVEAGAARVLAKPVDPAELVRTVEEQLAEAALSVP